MRWWAWSLLLVVSWAVGAALAVLGVILMEDRMSDLEREAGDYRKNAEYWQAQWRKENAARRGER